MKRVHLWLIAALLGPFGHAREYHVSPSGTDAADGTPAHPLRTISAAAERAEPGDTVIVHAGTYRERVSPPRGGDSDTRRITYQAAPGETVIIKGSEVIGNWQPFVGDVWRVTLPNTFFGDYNPYQDVITGDWFADRGRPHHTGEVYLNGKSLYETHLLERVLHPRPFPDSRDPAGSVWTWFCESDEENTYIYANFHGLNPNEELVEINVRDACFYPARPGCNYITVRGFHMSQAATQWAAPTAEQIGLLGTHWSKGWIIERNVVSDSKCAGITLGKDRATGHNVWSNDPSKPGATHYNEVIARALEAGWAPETIGSHVVRHNVVFNCGQAGICGSLGAIFSRITDNHVYDIWTKRQFSGAEIAGIKIHAPIDTLIQRNRIHNTHRGIWVDWMVQGTRISRNLCYDNTLRDFFVEVSHGPYVVDNNIFLSATSMQDWSEGGAYVHNLFGGRISSQPITNRTTPFHHAHATTLAGLSTSEGADNRFYNNLFAGGTDSFDTATDEDGQPKSPQRVGYGLWVYDTKKLPLQTGGNVYFAGARPYAHETGALTLDQPAPEIRLVEEGDHVFLHFKFNTSFGDAPTTLVTTELLGATGTSQLPFENFDGSPLAVETDYFGRPRDGRRPTPGPFEELTTGPVKLRVW